MVTPGLFPVLKLVAYPFRLVGSGSELADCEAGIEACNSPISHSVG
jgi:hypothetical protein